MFKANDTRVSASVARILSCVRFHRVTRRKGLLRLRHAKSAKSSAFWASRSDYRLASNTHPI
jgi:hypothetical protein